MNLSMILILLAMAILLAILIMIIPNLIKYMANNLLNRRTGHSGNIEHLSIHIFKNKLVLQNTTIHFDDTSEISDLLLEFPVVEIQFSLSSLFKKIIDVNIRIEKPGIYLPSLQNFTKSEKTPEDRSAPFNLRAVFEKLVAFRVSMQLVDGSVHLRSDSNLVDYDINLDHINIEIEELSNKSKLSDLSRVRCTAEVQGGTADFSLSLRPLAPQLTLGLSFILKSINLAQFNHLTRTYGKVDIDNGLLNLSSEMVIASNEFDGYIHLVIDDLDFVSSEDQGDPIISKILERIVGGVYYLLSQSTTNQLALLIPFNGSLDDPSKGVAETIVQTIRKGFIKEFLRSLTDVHALWKGVEYAAKGFLRRLSK